MTTDKTYQQCHNLIILLIKLSRHLKLSRGVPIAAALGNMSVSEESN